VTRLSVCIPTYQGARHIGRCLSSVLSQQLDDFEVIVADDLSGDGTVEIARAFRDERIVVRCFPDRVGLANNWNRALGLVSQSSDYIAVMGQDDEVERDWAQSLIALLDRHKDADLAFGRRRFAFEDEDSRRAVGDFFERRYPQMLSPFYERIGERIDSSVMIEEAMRHHFEINLIGEPAFTIFRASSAAAREGFCTDLKQLLDWEFSMRFFVDQPIVHCPRTLGTYHIHARAQSIDNAPLSMHYREYHRLLESVERRFDRRLTPAQKESLARRKAEVLELEKEWLLRESSSRHSRESGNPGRRRTLP